MLLKSVLLVTGLLMATIQLTSQDCAYIEISVIPIFPNGTSGYLILKDTSSFVDVDESTDTVEVSSTTE